MPTVKVCAAVGVLPAEAFPPVVSPVAQRPVLEESVPKPTVLSSTVKLMVGATVALMLTWSSEMIS